MTTDYQLLQRVASNDKHALEALYDRYHLLLWKICWKNQENVAICEQLITRVFQEVWHHSERFLPHKPFMLELIRCCKEKIENLNNLCKVAAL